MNNLTVILNGDEFQLSEFFDCDNGSGITVKNNDKIIGEIWGMNICSDEDVIRDPEEFLPIIPVIEKKLENWLICHYY